MFISIFLVDTFTDKHLRGNTAGVVLEADDYSRELKQQIAAELKASDSNRGDALASPRAGYHGLLCDASDESANSSSCRRSVRKVGQGQLLVERSNRRRMWKCPKLLPRPSLRWYR